MLSLPDCVSTPLVYLSIGVLPATAQRDLDILGLLGQLALSDNDDQNVMKVINHNLAFFDEKFGGWSGLVRKTAEKYGLPDPLLYMVNPWRPDRWRAHCRTEIVKFWDNKLRNEVQYSKDGEQKSSAIFIDTESVSTTHPMRIWQQAGLSSQAVKEATPVSWMFCGTYFTRELLYKMKRIKSPACVCDGSTTENLSHFLLTCDLYSEIRIQYIPQYLQMNKYILNICDNETNILISILDPLSCKLPVQVTSNWNSVSAVYALSRTFVHRMHLKREKIYSEADGND